MFPFRVFRRRRTTLAPPEVAEFYPSYGSRTAGGWRIVVQGCVFNPQLPWFRRRPVMAVIRRAMRVDRSADEFFRRRMQRFLLDPAAGRKIVIRVGDQTFSAGESGLAGLFRQEIDVPNELIEGLLGAKTAAQPWIPFSAQLAAGDDRQFTGRLRLVEPEGLSIVSDVNDTIKHSNVPNRRDLFHNTFSREFSPIEGMSELYRACDQLGAVFHFVSGSPWQLYDPLSEFLRAHGFPSGTFHLKPFRIRDTARKIRGPTPQLIHKRTALEPILNAFPARKFILIGDSGEQDALVYGGFLRERPKQVLRVFIRSLREFGEDDARLRQAFEGCDPQRWRLYRTPAEIRDELLGSVSRGLSTRYP